MPLCIEVGADGLTIHVLARETVRTECFAYARGVLGDARAMAEPAAGFIRALRPRERRSAAVVLRTRRVWLRVTEDSGNPRDCFPYGEKCDERSHVFSRAPFFGAGQPLRGDEPPGALAAAAPSGLAEACVEMCVLWGLKPSALKRIDTVEHLLARRYADEPEPLWLCLPLEDALRLIHLRGGQPTFAGLTGLDAEAAGRELDRILLTRPDLAGTRCAIVTEWAEAVGGAAPSVSPSSALKDMLAVRGISAEVREPDEACWRLALGETARRAVPRLFKPPVSQTAGLAALRGKGSQRYEAGMNLLPVRERARRRFMGRLRKLLAAEAAAAVLIGIAAFGLSDLSGRAERRLLWLEEALADPAYQRADEAAAAVRAAKARATAAEGLETQLRDADFLSRVFTLAHMSAPDGVSLLAAEVEGGRLTLSALTEALPLMEAHRGALAESGLFARVRLGAVTRDEDGRYRYSLTAEGMSE